jgi:hypothetical protein
VIVAVEALIARHKAHITRLAAECGGRSTQGAPQPYSNPPDWPQISWMSDFTVETTADLPAIVR